MWASQWLAVVVVVIPHFCNVFVSGQNATETAKLPGFGDTIQVAGSMQRTDQDFKDGLALDMFSPKPRTLVVTQNQAPLPAQFVVGATGENYISILNYSYIITFNETAEDLIAKIEIPYDPVVLQSQGVQEANTWVATLAADKSSWIIDERTRNIHRSENNTRIIKMTSLAGEYMLVGRRSVDVSNIFVQYGQGETRTVNFTGGQGRQEAEFVDGLRFSAISPSPLRMNVDFDFGVNLKTLPSGTMPLNNFAWIVNTTNPKEKISGEMRVPFNRKMLAAVLPNGSSPTTMLTLARRPLNATSGEFLPFMEENQVVLEITEDRILVTGLTQFDGQWLILITPPKDLAMQPPSAQQPMQDPAPVQMTTITEPAITTTIFASQSSFTTVSNVPPTGLASAASVVLSASFTSSTSVPVISVTAAVPANPPLQSASAAIAQSVAQLTASMGPITPVPAPSARPNPINGPGMPKPMPKPSAGLSMLGGPNMPAPPMMPPTQAMAKPSAALNMLGGLNIPVQSELPSGAAMPKEPKNMVRIKDNASVVPFAHQAPRFHDDVQEETQSPELRKRTLTMNDKHKTSSEKGSCKKKRTGGNGHKSESEDNDASNDCEATTTSEPCTTSAEATPTITPASCKKKRTWGKGSKPEVEDDSSDSDGDSEDDAPKEPCTTTTPAPVEITPSKTEKPEMPCTTTSMSDTPTQPKDSEPETEPSETRAPKPNTPKPPSPPAAPPAALCPPQVPTTCPPPPACPVCPVTEPSTIEPVSEPLPSTNIIVTRVTISAPIIHTVFSNMTTSAIISMSKSYKPSSPTNEVPLLETISGSKPSATVSASHVIITSKPTTSSSPSASIVKSSSKSPESELTLASSEIQTTTGVSSPPPSSAIPVGLNSTSTTTSPLVRVTTNAGMSLSIGEFPTFGSWVNGWSGKWGFEGINVNGGVWKAVGAVFCVALIL